MKSSKVSIGNSILASQYNNLRDDAFGGGFLLPHEQATPDLTLKVEAGVCYVGNTRVIFATGNSPSFTAPTTNPRIDLLVIDSAGVLSRVVGTEAATPAVPAYPNDKLVICEVFNRVGQTTIRDTDTAGQGFIQQDVRPFLGGAFIASDSQVAANAAISVSKINFNSNVTPDADASRNLGSAALRFNEGRFVTLFGDASNLTGLSSAKLTKSFTAGEAITAGRAVYLKAADGKVYHTNTSADEATFNFIGFAESAIALDASGSISINGVIGGFSALSVGVMHYLNGTAGQIATTPTGARIRPIGISVSSTEIYIIGQKTKVATGIVDLVGVETSTVTIGFRPSMVFIHAFGDEDNEATGHGCSGASDGNTNNCIFQNNASFPSGDTTKAWNTGGFAGVCDTFSETGFRLNQTADGGTNCRVIWIAIQ